MPGKGRPPQAIPSPISRHIITCYVRYQGSKHTVIYILVQTITSVQAKLEVVRRKHIVHLTGFGAYSSTCYKGTNNCAGTMGVDQLPSSTVRLIKTGTVNLSPCVTMLNSVGSDNPTGIYLRRGFLICISLECFENIGRSRYMYVNLLKYRCVSANIVSVFFVLIVDAYSYAYSLPIMTNVWL